MSALAKLHALGNRTRYRIVDLVREREVAAGDIARRFRLTRPAVSQRVGILRAAGVRRAPGRSAAALRGSQARVRRNRRLRGELLAPRLQRLKLAAEALERDLDPDDR